MENAVSSEAETAHGRKIAVIGLGYVGLPVAAAFARAGAPVVAFDISHERVAELAVGRDRTRLTCGPPISLSSRCRPRSIRLTGPICAR
jgi:threonine dehydrogenase-like Zn-dependent dehydrogenase